METAAEIDVKMVADRDRERAGAVLAEQGDMRFLGEDLTVKGEALAREGHHSVADAAAHLSRCLRVAVCRADLTFAGKGRVKVE